MGVMLLLQHLITEMEMINGAEGRQNTHSRRSLPSLNLPYNILWSLFLSAHQNLKFSILNIHQCQQKVKGSRKYRHFYKHLGDYGGGEVGRAEWAPEHFSKQKVVSTSCKTSQKLLQDFTLFKKFPPTHRDVKFTFMLIFFSATISHSRQHTLS